MKKTGIAIICVLSVFVIAFAGTAAAFNADYTHTNYMSSVVPTMDGTYTSADEWAAAASEFFGTNGFWRDEWTLTPVTANLFIETGDSTNDPGDYWAVCFDSTAAGGETPPNGGAAPQTDDYKVVVTGHDPGTVQWYKGTGTGWTPVASPSAENFGWAQALTTTPAIGTPHYALELQIEKTNTELGTVIMGYNWAQYVAYYDAHAGGNGLQSWPPAPASPDVPDGWGYIGYEMAANPNPEVPEGIGFIAMTAVSSIALLAGAIYIRKKTKP